MGSSKKTLARPPLDTSLGRSTTSPVTSPSSYSSSSTSTGKKASRSLSEPFSSAGPGYYPAAAAAAAKPTHSRKSSGSSTRSMPQVNVYTHCGRHTDQFLFGGRRLSDLWGLFKKNKDEKEVGVAREKAGQAGNSVRDAAQPFSRFNVHQLSEFEEEFGSPRPDSDANFTKGDINLWSK